MKSFGYDPVECEKCGGKMMAVDVFYKGYGSVMEIYRRRVEAEVNAKVKEAENIDRVIREITNGNIEPVFA